MDNKYVVEIYDVTIEELPLDKWVSDELKKVKPVVTEFTDTKAELLEKWNALIKDYEGWAYVVFDIVNNICIVGGAFDPMDEEVIQHY